MDRVTSMMSFVQVAEHGGFSAAARRLNMSTSMVTTHVKTLEDRLGVRLLNRSTRKVSLTEVGQAYYDRCVQILAEIEAADQIAEALQSKPRGILRLNVAPPVPRIIAPVIAEYGTLYPDVSIQITLTSRMVDMVVEAFDLAIRILPVPDSSLIVRRLATYRFVVCGAASYFASHGRPKHPNELTTHNCMLFSDAPWEMQWRFRGPGGDHVVRLSGNLRTNSGEALRRAALLGQGLIYAPIFLVDDDLKSGALEPVLTEFSAVELSIDAIYPDRRHLSSKVRCLIDLLAKRLHDATWADALAGAKAAS